MTPAGWIFMAVSIGLVVALVVFCFARVLSKSTPAGRSDGPPDTGARKADQ